VGEGNPCLKCHEEVSSRFEKSAHAQMGFSCLNCHQPHDLKNPKLPRKKKIKTICYQCHDDKKKFFENRPHGIIGLECMACHLPHASDNQHLLRGKVDGKDFCQSCHTEEPHHFIADKRTRKMEKLKCVACHEAHSKEKKYLVDKKEDLCVNCHKAFY
jgi:predicted CXXCH cytochrome family protein